jgi:two-component system response regulator TctD
VRILVAEDDAAFSETVKRALQRDHHVVDCVRDGAIVDRLLRGAEFDAIVLELALPTTDGCEVLRRMRRRGDRSPVIALSTRGPDADADAVKVLDLGADDYLRRPLDVEELCARVRALLRRENGFHVRSQVYGGLKYDTLQRTATVSGAPCLLSNREASVLEALLQSFGKPVKKERLMSQVYGLEGDVGWNTLEVYVHRLRKKLVGSALMLRTLHGRGYQLELESAPGVSPDLCIPTLQASATRAITAAEPGRGTSAGVLTPERDAEAGASHHVDSDQQGSAL